MATIEGTRIRNFIGGEERDPASGETRGDPEPRHRGGDRPGAEVGRAGRERRGRGRGARRSTAGRETTPGERALALLRIADAIEENAEELARIESLNVGKPYQATLEEELPVVADNLRFFAGAARNHGGQGGGRVHAGLHVDDPPRAGRRRRVDRALELPADDGRLEDRAGAGRRQHGRPEAVRADADDRGAPRPAGRRAPAARRAERDLRPRRAGRRARSSATRTWRWCR